MVETPIFDRILASGCDPSDRTVTVALGTAEGTSMRIDMRLGLVGPVVAAVAAEAAKLTSLLPDNEPSYSATLNAKAAWISEIADERPVIVFELENGTLLPLVMHSGDFAGLAAEMGLLAAKPWGHPH